jgi:decaprenyl-phosphate phosphoribosyltransferase
VNDVSALSDRPALRAPATAAGRPLLERLAGGLVALVLTARPRQWLKNLLVLAAPAAGGVLFVPSVAAESAWAAGCLTVAAAATYLVNDALDADADRQHPVKRRRPVAAGQLRARTAVLVGAGCALVAVVMAAQLGWRFAAVVVGYLTLTAAYSTRLKHVPVLDILVVAAGFVLRAAAGGVATGVPLSNWFLLVVMFGSLFLVAAKRAAELRAAGPGSVVARAALDGVPASWLLQVLTMSLTGTVMAYSLWAFQYVGQDVARPVLALSVVPFLTAMLRYSLLVHRGAGEEPERLVTSDRFLLVAGAVWVVVVGSGLYLA